MKLKGILVKCYFYLAGVPFVLKKFFISQKDKDNKQLDGCNIDTD